MSSTLSTKETKKIQWCDRRRSAHKKNGCTIETKKVKKFKPVLTIIEEADKEKEENKLQNTSSIAAAELGDDRWGFLKCCCGHQDCPCCMDEPMWETQFDTHQKNIEKLKQPNQPHQPHQPHNFLVPIQQHRTPYHRHRRRGKKKRF